MRLRAAVLSPRSVDAGATARWTLARTAFAGRCQRPNRTRVLSAVDYPPVRLDRWGGLRSSRVMSTEPGSQATGPHRSRTEGGRSLALPARLGALGTLDAFQGRYLQVEDELADPAEVGLLGPRGYRDAAGVGDPGSKGREGGHIPDLQGFGRQFRLMQVIAMFGRDAYGVAGQ